MAVLTVTLSHCTAWRRGTGILQAGRVSDNLEEGSECHLQAWANCMKQLFDSNASVSLTTMIREVQQVQFTAYDKL